LRRRAYAAAAAVAVTTLALTGCGAAIAADIAASKPAVAAGRLRPPAITSSASIPVVIDCAGHGQVRPSQYILPCADGKAALARLSWAVWGSSSAFAAAGISTFDDCIPSCVAGHYHQFPVLAALWRAEARPGHPGQRYFTRLTIIYTGLRSYRAGGQLHVLPLTVTYPLSPAGGA
jgi:hypothetical protein